MPAIGWKVGKETYTYEEATKIAQETGWFHDYPASALRAMRNQRQDKHWLSPSAAAGCPRQRALEQTTDYYTDLVGAWSPGVGTAVHNWLQRGVPGGNGPEITEIPLATTLYVPLRDGTITSFELKGTADYYNEDLNMAIDYKTISEFDYWHNGRRERVEKEIPTAAHIMQANLYKYLFEMNGHTIDQYWLWYARLHSDGQRRPVLVDLWSNDEIEEIACEVAEPLAWYQKTGELPQNKFDSKNKLCKYCPVSTECRKLTKEGK